MTTNKERLASIEKSIENIDTNIEKIADNNISQWKSINKNSQDIASHKSVIKIIETFLVSIGLAVVGLFIGKYK